MRITYLREKSVKTVNLLSLLHEGVVLRNTSQSELLHQVDFVWFSHIAILNEQHNLRLTTYQARFQA